MGKIEVEELENLPAGAGGFRGVWSTEKIREFLEKYYKKFKNGGKPVIGIYTDQAWAEWHGGEPGKHAGFYLRKKIIDVADEAGIKVAVVQRKYNGRDRVLIKFEE